MVSNNNTTGLLTTAIISNGDIGDPSVLRQRLPAFDFVICCDGGVRHLKALELEPDLILGDFDSADHNTIVEYKRKGAAIKQFTTDKDKTDTQIAVETAVEMGAGRIFMLGAIGSRWDHSYANVMLLVRLAEMGIDAAIYHSHNHIFVTCSRLCLSYRPGKFISLLPLGGDVLIESTRGLKYPVINQILPMDFPYGVSNVFTEDTAEVKVASGWLMAVVADD